MHVSPVKKLVVGSALVIGIAILSSPRVEAATATANLDVTATVTGACTIFTAPVSFGNYNGGLYPLGTPSDVTGSVTINCTNSAAATVTLSTGANAAAGSTPSVPIRRMAGPGVPKLSYDLYQDAARTTTFGGTAATGVVRTGTGADDVVSVYGRLPGGQSVPLGSYADTVVATVTF